MYHFLLLSALLVPLSIAAQQPSTTVSLFMPEADPQSLVASIIASDSTATTYRINCAAGQATSLPSASASSSLDNGIDGTGECGFPAEGVTQTQGPSTMALTYSYSTFTAAMSCQLTGTTRAVCTESQNVFAAASSLNPSAVSAASAALASATLSDVDLSAPQTTTLSASDITFLPVVVTAGAKQKPLQSTAAGKTSKGASAASKTGTAKAAHSTSGVGGRLDLVGFGAGVGAAAVGVVAAVL